MNRFKIDLKSQVKSESMKNIHHADSNQKSGSGYTNIGQNKLDKNYFVLETKDSIC